MKLTRIKICKLLALIMTFSILLGGCSRKNQNPQQSQNSQPQGQQLETQEEGDKVPEQLISIESSIEKIIAALDGPYVETEEESDKSGTQNQNKDKNKDEVQSQNKSQESSNSKQKKDDEQQQQGKEDKEQGKEQKEVEQDKPEEQLKEEDQSLAQSQEDPWQKIDPIINSLHYQWNSYMPMAVKMNAGKDLTEGFSTALNSLTNTIIGKNKTNTLMAASYLYSYIPDFFMLYKTSISPEIKRIRHYTRNAMLNGITGNWTQAESDLANLKSNWSLYRNILKRDQKESSDKLEYSIAELEKVIKEKNQPLTDIKGRVALANIQALEKENKKENKKKNEKEDKSGGNKSEDSEA